MSIKPSVGKRVRFKVWHDKEYIGKVYTDAGDNTNRPNELRNWTGEVVAIYPRLHKKGNVFDRDKYIIKRDFDGFEQMNYANELDGYV